MGYVALSQRELECAHWGRLSRLGGAYLWEGALCTFSCGGHCGRQKTTRCVSRRAREQVRETGLS